MFTAVWKKSAEFFPKSKDNGNDLTVVSPFPQLEAGHEEQQQNEAPVPTPEDHAVRSEHSDIIEEIQQTRTHNSLPKHDEPSREKFADGSLISPYVCLALCLLGGPIAGYFFIRMNSKEFPTYEEERPILNTFLLLGLLIVAVAVATPKAAIGGLPMLAVLRVLSRVIGIAMFAIHMDINGRLYKRYGKQGKQFTTSRHAYLHSFALSVVVTIGVGLAAGLCFG